jgi:hypothetical protein
LPGWLTSPGFAGCLAPSGVFTSGVLAASVPGEAAVPPCVFSVMYGAFRARQGIAAGFDMGRPRRSGKFYYRSKIIVRKIKMEIEEALLVL